MQGKDEILYYLIEDAFKQEKIVVFNRDKLLETLNQLREGMTLKRILHVPQKEEGQKEKLLAEERSLVEEYDNNSANYGGWVIIFMFIGLTLCYLLFNSLFILGYLPIINFLIRNFKTLNPEIVNSYADPGAQIAALAIGMILGFSPLIFSVVLSYDAFKKSKVDKKRAESIRNFGEDQLEIVENGGLSTFNKESMQLIEEMRKQAEDLRKIKYSRGKVEPCKRIRDHLERIIVATKLYRLDGVNEHYHRLHNSFYDLEKRLESPSFWRNDEKWIRELLGDSR